MPWRNCPSNATNDPSVDAEEFSPASGASGGGADGVAGGESSEGAGSKSERGDSLNGNSHSLLAWASRYQSHHGLGGRLDLGGDFLFKRRSHPAGQVGVFRGFAVGMKARALRGPPNQAYKLLAGAGRRNARRVQQRARVPHRVIGRRARAEVECRRDSRTEITHSRPSGQHRGLRSTRGKQGTAHEFGIVRPQRPVLGPSGATRRDRPGSHGTTGIDPRGSTPAFELTPESTPSPSGSSPPSQRLLRPFVLWSDLRSASHRTSVPAPSAARRGRRRR